MGSRVDTALGILNGTVGDYLVRTGNALATAMHVVPGAQQKPTTKAAVLIHGLMGTEAHWAFPDGSDYGSMLARDLGFTPVYVRYNTGQPISQNGVALSRLLEEVVEGWPRKLEEVLLIGHSMGGLVARAACHIASGTKSRWLPLVRRAIYLGTPHRGAPMERVGRVIARVLHTVNDPYTQLAGQLADLRSGGIKDLGDADLRAEDRARTARGVGLGDADHPVPLLPGIDHLLIAGTISPEPWLTALFGDSMVSVPSATNRLLTARILPGVTHMQLAHDSDAYKAIRQHCEQNP